MRLASIKRKTIPNPELSFLTKFSYFVVEVYCIVLLIKSCIVSQKNNLVNFRYVFGMTHIPRLEDWPVMPVERIGFMLMVSLFFCFGNILRIIFCTFLSYFSALQY